MRIILSATIMIEILTISEKLFIKLGIYVTLNLLRNIFKYIFLSR